MQSAPKQQSASNTVTAADHLLPQQTQDPSAFNYNNCYHVLSQQPADASSDKHSLTGVPAAENLQVTIAVVLTAVVEPSRCSATSAGTFTGAAAADHGLAGGRVCMLLTSTLWPRTSSWHMGKFLPTIRGL